MGLTGGGRFFSPCSAVTHPPISLTVDISNLNGRLVGQFLFSTLTRLLPLRRSIASSVFPVGTDVHFPEFYSAGLYWGLFCGAIANWTLLGLSRMPCAVGGTLLPAIIVIKRYAEAQIGPEVRCPPCASLTAVSVSV